MSMPSETRIAPERGTSRERTELALRHVEADRVPLDLGGGPVTGIHVSSLYRLRQALGLDAPGTPVKVTEPFQMLGEVGPDLIDALGVDVVGVGLPTNFFGFANEDWKPWTTFDGTPVLVPGGFNTDTSHDPRGGLFMYPQGDTTAPPSARMPKRGFYFDALKRPQPIDDEHLKAEDNLEEFGAITEAELACVKREVQRLLPSGKAILGNFGGTGFGDVAFVPGMSLKHPKGIRDIEEWYVSLSLRPGYIYEVFDRQCDLGLQNLARIHAEIGDSITAVLVTGTDFGGQLSPLISPRTYRNLFMPFHARVNDWIHSHTRWKTLHPLLRLNLAPARRHRGRGVRRPESRPDLGRRDGPRRAEAEIRRPDHLLGRRNRHAERAAFRHASRDPRNGAGPDARFRPGRRLRLQHRAQRAGRGPGREPAGLVPGDQ